MTSKQGFITKEGGRHKSWKKRWCVVSGNTLFYFKSPQDFHGDCLPKAKGSITLSGCTVEPVNTYKKTKFCFSVAVPVRTYYIDAPTESARESWIEVIRCASQIPVDTLHLQAKVVVLGPAGVGKTSLMRQWMMKMFSETYIPGSGVSNSSRSLKHQDGLTVDLNVTDIPEVLLPNGVPGGDMVDNCCGIILVFDLTNPGSFGKVRKWCRTLRGSPKRDVLLVGSKRDIENKRQINEALVQAFAEEVGAPYIECSAKTGYNVDNLFTVFVEMIYRSGKYEKVYEDNGEPNHDSEEDE